jgi:hypothetical protein
MKGLTCRNERINIFTMSGVYGSVTNNNGFWTGWLDLLTPSCAIARNHNQSSAEPFFLDCRGLAPLSFWFECSVLLIQSGGGPIENTSVVQQWIYANHIENTASSIAVFTGRCIETEAIRIGAWVFVAEGMCLPSSCPATGLHVTIICR